MIKVHNKKPKKDNKTKHDFDKHDIELGAQAKPQDWASFKDSKPS